MFPPWCLCFPDHHRSAPFGPGRDERSVCNTVSPVPAVLDACQLDPAQHQQPDQEVDGGVPDVKHGGV